MPALEINSHLHAIPVYETEQIPENFKGTPIEELFAYQNFNEDFIRYDSAQMVIVMCMDNRKQLRVPNRFAYIIRTPGARVVGFDFALSYSIGMAGGRYVALVAHTDCGMVKLSSKKDQVVEGLVRIAGWGKEQSENHFDTYAPFYEIENESVFVWEESNRLKAKYPNINFIPMLYSVKDHRLYLINEKQ